jgi:hypothetical protein
MSRLKILMFCDIPINLNDVKRGVQSAFVNLIKGFRKRSDIDVAVLSMKKEQKLLSTIDYAQNIKIYQVPLKYPNLILLDYLLNRKTLFNIISKEEPDIIHIQGASPHLLRFFG